MTNLKFAIKTKKLKKWQT